MRLRRRVLIVLIIVVVVVILIICYNKYTNDDYVYSLELSKKFRPPDFDGTETSCRCAGLQPGDRRARWPPTQVPEDLACEEAGAVDLTLCILANRTQAGHRLGEQPLSPDSKDWIEFAKNANYDAYPLAVNVTKIIHDLAHGKAIAHAPITNPNLRLLRHSQRICSPLEPPNAYKLVVVYKTGVFNFDDRARIRASYKHLPADVRVVFSTGQPPPLSRQSSPTQVNQIASHFHMLGGFDLRLPERAGTTHERWTPRSHEAAEKLYAEADEHDDLVVGDYVDSYANLTYKMLATHRWASAFCQGKTDTFLFLDDDYDFIVNNVLTYLAILSRQQRRELLSGAHMHLRIVKRPSRDARRNKWALTHAEMPWNRFPPYVSGAAYFVGADVLQELVIAEAYTRFLWVDDAFLGLVVAKLPDRSFSAMKGYYMESIHDHKALVTHWPIKLSIQWFWEAIIQFRNSLNL